MRGLDPAGAEMVLAGVEAVYELALGAAGRLVDHHRSRRRGQ